MKYDEENDEVYYELGRCNYHIKSFQDSIAHFKRAISIKPQESMYYFGLGCAYDEMGSTKNAKMAFYDAININPLNTQARIAYAISLTKELEYAQSIEQFNEVLKYHRNILLTFGAELRLHTNQLLLNQGLMKIPFWPQYSTLMAKKE